jgi:hypothetical protein
MSDKVYLRISSAVFSLGASLITKSTKERKTSRAAYRHVEPDTAAFGHERVNNHWIRRLLHSRRIPVNSPNQPLQTRTSNHLGIALTAVGTYVIAATVGGTEM